MGMKYTRTVNYYYKMDDTNLVQMWKVKMI